MTTGSAPTGVDDDFFDRIVSQYADGEKQAYESAAALQDHTDKMLTWLLGLDGAGLIAGLPLLKSAPPEARFLAVVPWLVGVIAALGARVIGAELRRNESLWHFEKAIRIRSLLLRPRELALRELETIINRDEPKLQCRHQWVARYGRSVRRWYYISLTLFGVGIVAVIAVASRWP